MNIQTTLTTKKARKIFAKIEALNEALNEISPPHKRDHVDLEFGATFQDAMDHFGFQLGVNRLELRVIYTEEDQNLVVLERMDYPEDVIGVYRESVTFYVSDEILAILPYILPVTLNKRCS